MNLGKIILYFCNLALLPFTNNFFSGLDKETAVKKTVNLYPNPTFIKIRFWDAPFIEVEKLIPRSGKILDLGCGEGIFTNFLGVSSGLRRILAFDLDKNRIKEASRGVKNVSLKFGDATKISIPKADAILMFHLLHHLPSKKSQEDLIKRCANKLSKKGKLIIVEVNSEFSIKYLLASFTDHFLVPWIFEKRFYSPVYFRNRYNWIDLLKKNDLSVKTINADKGKPFNHIIFVCQKSI